MNNVVLHIARGEGMEAVSAAPAGGESGALKRVLRMVKRRSIVIGAVAGAVFSLAMAYALLQPPTFRATALAALDAGGAPKPAENQSGKGARTELLDSEIQALRAPGLLRRFLDSAQGATIAVSRRGEFAAITATATDPRRAADAANGFYQLYLAERADAVADMRKRNQALLARRTSELDQEIAQKKAQALGQNQSQSAAPPSSPELEMLEVMRRSYVELAGRAAAENDFNAPALQLVSQALPPSRPVTTLGIVILLSLGACLVSGLCAGGLVELLDIRVGDIDQVAEKTGARAVGSIPMLDSAQFRALSPERRNPAGYLVEKPMSGFAEAIRLLHDAIFEARENGETLVVGITSALAREGNTTLSLCLARMAAMSGHRVMLLDCNRRRPSTSNLVGKNFARGLVGVLVEKGAWRAHFVPDTDSAAHILPSGPQKMIMRDTFSSPEMHQLISELREAYDLVILDCPPILAVAETTILAQHADLLLMVTRAGETSGASARAAVGMAERAKSDFAGIVLNCLKRSRYNESAYYRGSQHKNANARHL